MECVMMNVLNFGIVARRVICVAGCFAALTSLTGCLSQGQYDRLREAYTSCQARNAELTRERDEARVALTQLQGSMGKGEGTLAELSRQNTDLRSQLDKALADYAGMQGKIAGLSFGPLDATTTQQLEGLERQFPDLIKFDSARGMLRVASDLTFDSGSAAVKDGAKQALSALSQILASGSASQYEIVVEGHTDSQRIANPNTIRNHPTNRHLSTNRANSVVDELAKMGVPQTRLMSAGWGEFRPSMPNNANGNTPGNRRVEIYLAKLPNTGANATASEPLK
jgi:chemotaxis protein MotB